MNLGSINITRRSFLKVSAATAVIVAIGPGSAKKAVAQATSPVDFPYTEKRNYGDDPNIPDKIEVSGCMWCQNACSMKVHIKDGRVINIYGNPEDPVTNGRLCPKSQCNVQILYNKYRLKKPLKRTGPRGSGQYEEISWEQALDEIAEKLKKVREEYGGEALGMWNSGRSETQARSGLTGAFRDLFGTRNRETTGPYCNYSGNPAGTSIVGTRNPPWKYELGDFYSADWYLFVGSNMAATKPVAFGNLLDQKIKNNAKIIVVDPRQSESASKADIWLPIKPGVDMAFPLAMMYHIVANGLEDKEFIEKYVLGFDKLKEFLLEKKYTPEWASKILGIPASTIKELAEEYAKTEKAIIMDNSGVSHHTYAVQAHRAFYMLAAMTGHYGKPAMGYACGNNGGTSVGGIKAPKELIPTRKPEIRKNPSGWIEAMKTGKPYPLKALISCGSPLSQWPEQDEIRAAMDNLEISVYYELFPNVNAYYFDYILPMAPWVESGGLAPISDERRSVFVPKLVPEAYDSRPDRYMWIQLGKRMGWGDIFKDEYNDPIVLQKAMAEQKKVGFTPERFLAKPSRALRGPMPSLDAPEVDTLFLEGTTYPGKKTQFPTKSGKIEIWTEDGEKKFNVYGLSALPEFYADPEVAAKDGLPYLKYLDSDAEEGVLSPFQKNNTWASRVQITTEPDPALQQIAEKYDTYLTSGRPSVVFMGNGTHWAWQLDEMMPDQHCWIHPKKASRLGIKDGDTVRVESIRGYCEAKAWVYEGIREDTVWVPYSWEEKQPYHPWRPVNFLTERFRRCPISGQINYKALLCKVRKV